MQQPPSSDDKKKVMFPETFHGAIRFLAESLAIETKRNSRSGKRNKDLKSKTQKGAKHKIGAHFKPRRITIDALNPAEYRRLHLGKQKVLHDNISSI